MEEERKVVLITGASSGIGKACAYHLNHRGYKVYGTSRKAKPSSKKKIQSDHLVSDSIDMIRMDVDDDTSVQGGVNLIFGNEGRLDVVVNSAGYSLVGSVEDTSLEEARAQIETNFFGVLRVCKAVLPIMRKQNSGYIINISSIGGLIGVPFQGLYCASKFALEGLIETLRMEVKLFGIHAVLIEPGDFNTPVQVNRRIARKSQNSPVYLEKFNRSLAVLEDDERKGPLPDRIAYLVEKIIKNPSPHLRYTIGPAIEKIATILKKIVPHSLFEWGITKYYKIL